MLTDRRSRESSLGVVLIALAAVAWSTAGYFSQLIHLPLLLTLFWRNLFGGLFILGFLTITRRAATISAFRSLGLAGWIAATVNGLATICYLGALRNTSVTNVVVIYATAPFVAAALGYVLYRERTTARTLVAGLIALAGVSITVIGSPGNAGLLGDLMAFGMTVGLSIFAVITRRYPDRSMIAASAAAAWIGGLVVTPFLHSYQVSPVQIGQLALFGLVSFGLGLVLFTLGARRLDPARTALIAALDTPLAPLWVWLAFGSVPTAASLWGGAVVIVAVVINIISERPTDQAANRSDATAVRT